jgi:hypothetical protein
MTFGGWRERFRNYELPGGHPAISWALAPEIGDALWQRAKKLLSGVKTPQLEEDYDVRVSLFLKH